MYNDALLKNIFKKYLVPARIPLVSINTLLAGHCIGLDAMSALTLMLPVFMLFGITGAWINIGAFTQVMIAIGENRPIAARSYSSLALIWTAALSILIGGLLLFSWQSVVVLLSVPESLRAAADIYGKILAAGGIFIAFVHYPFNFLKIAGLQQLNIRLLIAMSILDAALGLAFIYLFKLETAGIALAVVLAMALPGLWGFIVLKRAHRQNLFGRVQNFWASSRDIFVSGSAIALSKVYDMVQIILLNWLVLSMLGDVGLIAFAAVLAALNICRVLFSIVIQPVTPLVGLYYGQRDVKALAAVLRLSLQKGIIFALLPLLILLLFPERAARIAGAQGESLLLAVPAFRWLAAALIPMGLNTIFIAYYAAIGKARLANCLAVLRTLIIVLAYTEFAAQLPDFPLWANYAVAEWLTLLVMFIFIICRGKSGEGGITKLTLTEPSADILAEQRFIWEDDKINQAKQCQERHDFYRQYEVDAAAVREMEAFFSGIAAQLNSQNNNSLIADIRLTVSQAAVKARLCCTGNIFAETERQTIGRELGNDSQLTFKQALGLNQVFLTVKRVSDF